MAELVEEALRGIEGERERIDPAECQLMGGEVFSSGPILRVRFRPEAPVQVLFSGHMDTVYGLESGFQKLQILTDGRLHGPGVADMKGGLLVLIEAVKEFLKRDRQGRIGGEILITSDEEIGSPASHEEIILSAKRNHYGLVFESALPGGELVSARKGTGTFRITAHGKAAHTGRDYWNGRNAIAALASAIGQVHALNAPEEDCILNVGKISGGGAVNIVPDYAEAWINVRSGSIATARGMRTRLEEIIGLVEAEHAGVNLQLEGEFSRPPRVETETCARLHRLWNRAEQRIGLPTSGKRETGGSSDGNLLAEAGLPHLDGVGIRGGAIHSPDEFALAESIGEQIARTVAFLKELSNEEH